MYTNHFGLRSKPFEDRADPQFFVATPHHEEALAAMEYESHRGEGLTLVIGEAGTGKTLLIRSLVLRLHATDRVIVLTCPRQGEMDLIRETGKAFGVTLPTNYKPDRGLARLRSDLLRSANEKQRSILIIDQAEALSDENLSHLIRFAELEDHERALISIILVGRTGITSRLERSDAEPLQQNIVTERRVPPLSLVETDRYIRHRLHVAGGADVPLFEDDAVAAIHRASGGIPRVINRLCEKSLLSAFGANERKVTRETAVEVIQEQIGRERSMNAREAGLPSGGDLVAGLLNEGPDTAAPWPTQRLDPPSPATTSEHDRFRKGWDDPYFEPPTTEPDTFRHDVEVDSERTASALLTEDAVLLGQTAPANKVVGTTSARRNVGSFDPPTMVESQLATLTAEARFAAESLVHRLNQTKDTTTRLQGRIDLELVEAERRAAAVNAELNRVVVLSTDAAEHTKRLETSCGRAERIEGRLAAFADELVDKADRVQERIAQLMSGLDAGEAAQQTMLATVEGMTRARKDAESALDRKLDAIARAAEQALDRKLEQISRTADQALDKKLDEISRASDKTLHTKLGQVSCAADEAEQRVATYEARLRKVEEDVASRQHATAEESLDEYRRLLRSEFENIRQAQAESMDAGRRQIEELRESVSTLTSGAERVKGSANDDHERLQLGQQAYAELAGKVETQLEGMRRNIESVSRDAADGIARLRAQRDAVAKETVSFHEQFTETSLDAYRRRLQEQSDRFERLHVEMLDTIETGTNNLREQVAAVSAQSSATLAQMRAEHQKLESDGTAAVRRVRAAMEEALREFAQPQAAAMEEARERHERQFREFQAEQQERLERAVECASGKVRGQIEGVRSTVAEADATIMAAIAEHRSRTAEVLSECREEFESLNRNLDTLRQPVVELGEMTDGLASRIDRSTEQVRALSDTTAELEATVTATAQQGDASRAALENAVEHIERMLPEVHATTGRVESLQRQASGMLVEIGATCERAREMREQTAGADQVLARLAKSSQEANEAAESLERQVEAGEGIEETMRRLAADADGRIAQLDSHNAAAGSVLHRLADANMSAHGLITQANDATLAAKQATDAAKTEAARAAGNLSVLCSTSNELARTLRTANEQAERVIEQLNDSTEPAAALAEQLAHRIGEMREKVGDLTEQCAHAADLADRLTPLANVLSNAKDLDESARATIDDARHAQVDLAALVETVHTQKAELREIQKAVQDLMTAQQRLGQEAGDVSEKLAERIGSAGDLQETGEHLLHEFVTQARSLETQITTLRKQSADVERRVSEALTSPGEVIATAKAQAAELERVCTAVRKVFAGLSKVSLEAQEHTSRFKKAGRNAEQRLASLAADTDRASKTLHEWIEEAVRVQARLERTLDNCPSIRETHSGAELRAVLGGMKVQDAPAERPQSPSDDRSMELADECVEANSDSVRKPSATAAEIAQLIEDAKSAAGGVSGRVSV